MNKEHKIKEWMDSRKERLEHLSCSFILPDLLAGKRGALASALTLIESNTPAAREESKKLLKAIQENTGKSWRIGITGVPGVGKSTFIEALGKIILEKGHKLAVLAIDPSSNVGGGSILGDKTRMNWLATQENVFIRPSATNETLGGVAKSTRESILLCEAAGYDVIFVETVGVGQSETVVHSMVDFFLLLMLAGAGDELQGIKRGIMEMADAILITKADGDNEKKALQAKREYQNAQHLFPAKENLWLVPVSTCSSVEGIGIPGVYTQMEQYFNHIKTKGWYTENRSRQDVDFFKENLHYLIEQQFFGAENWRESLRKYETLVKSGTLTPLLAAEQLFTEFTKKT